MIKLHCGLRIADCRFKAASPLLQSKIQNPKSKIVTAALIVLALTLSACGGGGFGDKGGRWGKKGDEDKKDPLVEVVPAWRGSIPTLERSNGRTEARNFADVYAQVTEVVLDVTVDVGDKVQRGALLARMKSDEQLLSLRATQLALQEAELLHTKNELDLAKRKSELERIERYFDPAKPEQATLFSKEAYEAAKLEYDKARNAVQTSRLALSKAEGAVAATALTVTQTDMLAPITGYITERNVRENEIVSNGALAFRIADFDILEVNLDVAEARLSALRPPERVPGIGVLSLGEKVRMESAQAVLLSPTAFPGERFLAYVDRINPTVDEARGMVVVVVRVIQPGDVDADLHANLLNQFDRDSKQAVLKTSEAARGGQNLAMKPGMWVNALIATEFIENALLIPGAAVVGDEELIWVVTPDKDNPETGVAKSVDISARRGVQSEGSIELKPLPRREGRAGGDEAAPKREMPDAKEGSLIVVRGQTLLRDGQRVRIKDISR